MKTRVLTLTLTGVFILLFVTAYSQKGIVNNGAKIAVSSGAIIKISGADGNYTNNSGGGNDGRIDLDGKIRIEGDWNNSASGGSVLINVDNDGEIIFQGSAIQSIQGNTTNFEKVTLDNTNGITLQANANVNGDFTFTNGRMTLGSYNLILGASTSILGTPSATKMFVATGTGELRKLYSANGAFTFPVGDNTGLAEYSPITLDFTSGSYGASAYAGVRVIDAKHPNNNAATDFITRYWRITENNITGFNCDVTGTYLTADVNGTEANMFTGKWDSPNWMKLDPVTTALNQISGTVTSFSDFTAGGQDMFCSPAIVISVNATDVTCYGGNDGEIDLTITNGLGPYTFIWATSDGSGLTAGLEDQTGLSEGTYDVTVTDYNGCTAVDNITITYINNPVANAGADDDLCPGQTTVQLNATGGTSYVWSPSSGLSSATIPNPVADPSATTTYFVTVTDAAGCTDVDDVVVTVNTLPNASAGVDQTICNGESATITATGGGTYMWDQSLGSGATHIVTPATTTTYTVTVTDANGCTDSDDMDVNVNDLPIVDAGTDQSIPNGTNTALDATVSGGSGSYTYSWTPAGDLVNPTVVDPTTQILTTTTTFNLLVTDVVTSCQNSDDVVVTVTGGALSATPFATPSIICEGDVTQLNANASGGSGSYTYDWSSSPGTFTSTAANPTDSPVATTTYTVTVDDGFTSVAETVIVTVNLLPAADAGADDAICEGGSTTITASGGTIYTWNQGLGSGAFHTVNPVVTTTYTVTVEDVNGCTDTDDVIVTVNTLPSANAGSDDDLCPGQTTVSLNASGGTSYAWSPATGLSATNINNPVANPAATTTYTVTVTDGNGCTDTDDVIVTVNTLPSANAGSDKTICENGSTTINASGGVSYNWDNGLGTGASHTVNPIVTTTYTVTVTGSNGCTDTDNTTVFVNPLPPADAGTDFAVCEGESVTLTATGGTNYSWDNGVDQGVPFTPTATTTYTVTVTDGNGCSDTDDITVTVNSLPLANAGANQTICLGETAVLTATGGTGYEWSTNETTATINVSPTTTTNYTVTVTGSNGCTNTDDVNVTVNPLPIPDAGADQTVCEGESVTLVATGGISYTWSDGETQGVPFIPTATNTYTVTVEDANGCTATDNMIVTVLISPNADAGVDQTVCEGDDVTLIATGGTSYSWNNGVSQGVVFNPTVTNTYTVTVTAANGCTDSDDVIVNVNPAPPANAGTDQNICDGESANLTASGGTSYYWSTTETTPGITVSPISTTTYFVTVTDGNGCTATDDIIVNVNSLPIANAGTDVTVCEGESVTLIASGGVTYSWSGGVVQATPFTPTATSTYTVTVEDVNGCTSTDMVVVTVNPLPVADAGSDQTVCNGEQATLTATGGTTYTWSGGIAQGVAFTPTTTTDYYVTVIDANGCSDTDTVQVVVNDLPTVDAGINQSIPNGTTAVLDATVSGGSGTYTYSWAPADSLVNPSIEDPTTVNLYTTNVLTLTVTDAVTGCQNTDNVTITVTGGPLSSNPYADPDTICNGETTQLFAIPSGGSGTYTYNWSSTPVGFTSADENPVINPVVTTTYTVTVDDGSNTVVNSTVVVVNQLPNAFAGNDTTICEGQDIVPTATGGVTYSWSNGIVQGVAFTPTTTDDYYVTVTDINGCFDVDDITVTVNISPVANAGADQTICEGESVTLSAIGGDTYTWDNGVTQDVAFYPLVTETYNVTVTATNGCTDVDSVEVIVNHLPVADAGADQTICQGDAVTLTATGGTIYNWSGSVSQGVAFTPTATADYYVTVSDANGCDDVDTVTVTVNPLPVAEAGQDTAICEGESIVLMATGGVSYDWSGGVTQGASFVPTSTQVYTVTVTDANGCSAVDNVTVSVDALPVVNAGLDQSISYLTNTVIDATVSGGSGSYIYNWMPSDSLIDGSIVDPTTINLHATTVFTLEVTDAITGCINTDDVMVTVTGGPLVANPYADMDTICEGESTQIYALASGGSGTYTYSWTSNPAGFTSTDADPMVSPVVYTMYIVTIDDGSSTYMDSVDVSVTPLPAVELGPDTMLCSTDTITLDAGAGFDEYLWSTGETTQTISVDSSDVGLATATYYVTVTNNGCQTTDYINITFDPCSDIDETSEEPMSISLYPNPTSGIVYINYKGFDEDVSMMIMDMTGKMIYSEIIKDQQAEIVREINLNNFAEGTYVIKFVTQDEVIIKRVVLSK